VRRKTFGFAEAFDSEFLHRFVGLASRSTALSNSPLGERGSTTDLLSTDLWCEKIALVA